MSSFVIEVVVIVVLAAVLSAWAHYAQCHRALRIALVVLMALISLPLVAAGAAFLYLGGHQADNPGLLLAFGLAIGLPLLRPVRLIFSALTPMSADSVPDMLGLALLASVSVMSAYSTLTNGAHLDIQSSPSVVEIIGQSLAEVLVAFFGVGWIINRGTRPTLSRLGLRLPTLQEAGIGLALVLAAFAVTIISGVLTQYFEPQVQREIDRQLKEITQNVSSGWGAVVLGASAGIGEEILFRGAIQPRFGIVLTSLVFALLHTQYGFSLTVVGVFALGMLLGWERRRYGTTTSIITHGVYDMLAVLLGQ